MKQINKINKFVNLTSQNKANCPFLGNYFKIDASTTLNNQIPSNFLKKFSNVCPHLKRSQQSLASNPSKQQQQQNIKTSTSNVLKCPFHQFEVKSVDECDSKQECQKCPHKPHGNNLSEISKEDLQKSALKCPFVNLLNIKKEEDINQKVVSKDKNSQSAETNESLEESILGEIDEQYDYQFQESIQGLKKEGTYRIFNHIKRIAGRFPRALYTDAQSNETKEIIVWCSNDYLGMGQNPLVKQAMFNAVKETGVGAGGTRNIGGSSVYHTQLEREIADLHGKEKSIVMSSGFVANQGAINALTKVLKNVVYLSDEKNHASIIEGIRNSNADKIVWKHNDLQDLERILKELPIEQNKIIIFESVYSMSGSISPIKEIAQLAKQYNALTFIDEVHAIGLYGKRGGGVAEQVGVMDEIDIFSGTLGKAYGCVGGYIAGNALLIDCIRSFAQNFIFTTSIPPCIASAAATSISYVKQHNELREKIHSVARSIKSKCQQKKIPILPNNSHIIPVFIGDAVLAKKASDMLMKQFSIYVQPINYPTVPRGQELLRVSPTPNHTEEMVDKLIIALDSVFQQLQLRENFKKSIQSSFTGLNPNNSLAEQILILS